MLVLSRKLGERIMIGDDVTVEVVEVKRGKVRLAIQAPEAVQVNREEVYLAINGTPTVTRSSLEGDARR